jgi:hypothetical protein
MDALLRRAGLAIAAAMFALVLHAASGAAQVPRDSAARADSLAEGMLIEARFSPVREVVLLMADGGTVTLRGVHALRGRVLGISEQRVISMRVDRATAAPGTRLPRGYAGGTAFVIDDATVTLVSSGAEPSSDRRAGAPEWLLGALVPLAAIVLVLRYGL